MKLRLQSKPAAILLASIAALAGTAQVKAQNSSWLGDGGSTGWSDPANWQGGIPGGPVVQLFYGTAFAASPAGNNATTSNNDLSGVVLQKLTFEANAPAFTITGNALKFAAVDADAAQIINNSASLQSINLGGTLTLSGGAAGFAEIKAVSGDLVFGATTGILLDNGTQLRLSADAARTMTIAGTVGGNGTLVKNGAGVVKLLGANTFTGVTTLNDGLLEFGTGSLGSSSISFGGGTLRYATGNTDDLSARLTNSASAIRLDTNGNNVTFGGVIDASNTGGLIKNGAGVLTMTTNASTFTGDVVINGGTLAITGGLLPPNPAGTGLGATNVARQVIVNAGGTLELRQHDILGNDAANPLLTMVVNGGKIVAQPGNQASGNGPFNILPAVTLNGGTISAAGGANGSFQSLSLKGTITVTGSAPSAITTAGSAALFDGVHLTQPGGSIFDVADVTGDAGVDFDISARLVNRSGDLGASALIKQGVGTMQLSNVENAYTGLTNVLGGTLLINGAISAQSNVLVADGAGFGRTGGGTLSLTNLQLAGQATLSAAATPATQSTGSIVILGDGAFTVGGGAGSVKVNVGGGGLTIGQTYTLLKYTGAFGGNAGTFSLGTTPSRVLGELVFNAANASLDFKVNATDAARWTGGVSGEWSTATLAAPKNWVLNSNGTTQTDFINGDSVFFTDAAARTDLTINGADISVGAMNFNNTAKDYTISGSKGITGGASLIKNGTGTLTISTANSFSGGATLNEGLVVFGNGGLGGAGPVTFGANATLKYAAGNTQDIGGRLANSTGAIRIDTNGNDVTFGGAIGASNTGGLIKNGAGVLTLSSTGSGFTGDLVINGGAVAATAGLLPPTTTTGALGNPAVARQVIINAGATLQLRQHDILGNDSANPLLTMVVNGGKIVSLPGVQASGNGPFNVLPAVTLNGGTISAAGGANGNFQSLSLKGTITVTGNAPSVIDTTGSAALSNGVHLTQGGGNIFDVADVTGNAGVDFEISARLVNRSGDLAPSALIKQGPGTMLLSNAENAYTGATAVNGGTLLINGGLSAQSGVTVVDGAGFGRTAGGTLTLSALQFAGGGTLSAAATPGTQTAGSIAVLGDGGFTVGGGVGSVTVNVAGGGLTAGQAYSLVKYTGFFGADLSTFVLGTLPSRATGSLVLNAANSSLDFNVTTTDAARWTGAASGEWSTAVLTPTKNWVLNSNGTTPTDFIAGDTVFFTDAATTTNVTINTADVTPGLANFDNSTKNYTLSGSKGIAGGATLTKSGTGTLTITNVNNFTGGTTINAGVIEFGNGGLGAAGSITFTGGKLRYATGNTQDISGRFFNSTAPIRIDTNGNNLTFGGSMSATNTGGFIKDGAGVVQINSGQSYTGDTVINGGTINVGINANVANPTATGLGDMTVARQVVINAGAQVTITAGNDSFGQYNYASPVTFVVDGGTFSHGNQFLTINNVVLKNGGRLTGNNGVDARFSGFSILGSVTVSGTGASFLSTTGTVNPGTNLGSETNGNVIFTIGNTGAVGGDFIVTSPLLWEATAHTSSVIKNGPGTMVLNYNAIPNLYPGATVIDEGTIIVNGAINPITTVSVGDNAGFGRLAPGPLTVAALAFANLGTLSAYANPSTQTSGSIIISTPDGFTVGGGDGSITVNVGGSGLVAGQTYSLVKFAGNFPGSAATFTLGTKPAGAVGSLILNALNGSLDFMVTSATSTEWRGAASGSWSTAVLTPTKNWVSGATPVDYTDGASVTFNDTATTTNVTIDAGNVSPGSVSFENSTKNYSLSGANGIAGTALLSKSGTGTLTITNVNSYTGGTALKGGTIEFVNGGLGTSGNLTFAGGKLRFAAGNTQDISGRIFNSTGPVQIDTNGNNLTFNSAIGATNTGGFIKDGAGVVQINVLQGYSGDTVINGGTVNVGLGANVPNPTATGLGDMTVARKVIINAGAQVTITGGNDSFGQYNYASPVTFVVDGGTFSHGNQFLTINNVVLKNGGRLTGNNGVDARFSGFSILGSVTVSGTGASFLSTTGTVNPGTNLGTETNGNVIFTIGNTGAVGGDFIVTSPLLWEATAHTSSVIKNGPGTMVLNYNAIPNLYPGATVIDEGTIIVNGAINPITTVSVGDNAGFGRLTPGPLTVSTLAFANHGTLSAFASPATQTSGSLIISTPDGFTVGGGDGSITVNVGGSGLSAGQTYSLVKFSGNFSGTTPTFTLGTKPAGVVGSLILNALSGSLDFAVSSAASTEWRGAASGSWSTAVMTPTKNWVSGATPVDYTSGDSVTFNDAAVNTNVTIDAGDVTPSGVNFNNSTKDYTLSGPNAIAGAGSLIKGGTGTLTVTNANSFTGGTFLNGGTVVASAGALGTSGAISFGGGTLRYAAGNTNDFSGRINNSTAAIRLDTGGQDMTYASAINGTNTGGFVKLGAGRLTLSSNASGFTGDMIIEAGAVSVTGGLLLNAPTGTALGNTAVARQIIVNAAGTLEFRTHDIFGNVDANPAVSIVLNGGKLVSLSGSQPSGNGPFNILPAITMRGGTLTATNGAFDTVQSLSLKGPVTVAGNAPSIINTTGTPALLDGVHLSQSGGNVFDVSDVTANAAVDLEVSARLINVAISSAPGVLMKLGLGTLQLSNAANAYTGPTNVLEGTLLLNGSITGSDLTVSNEATVGGQGTMKSLVLTGGTLSPSNPATAAQGIGTLTSLSDVLLQGTSHFDIQKNGGTLTADLLISQSQIIYAGKLEIVASGDALASGDVFNLFDAPALSGGVFDTLVLPTFTNPQLSWNTNNLTVDGTISVVPEPGSAALLLGGLGLVAGFRRRRANAK